MAGRAQKVIWAARARLAPRATTRRHSLRPRLLTRRENPYSPPRCYAMPCAGSHGEGWAMVVEQGGLAAGEDVG